MLRALVVLLLILELVAMGMYALQNQELTTVRFLTMSWPRTSAWTPTAVAMLVMLVTCILYAFVSGIGWRVRHHRLSRHVDERQAALEQLQRENAELHERLAGRRALGDLPAEPSSMDR